MALTPPPAAPDAPPPTPSRGVKATFSARMDALLVYLSPFRTGLAAFITWYGGTAKGELEALQTDVANKQGLATTAAENAADSEEAAGQSAAVAAASAAAATNAADVQGSSISSVSIPTALGQSRTFEYVETGRTPSVGQKVVVAATASPTANYMVLQLSAVTGTTIKTITGTVLKYEGTGTFNAWRISLTGSVGPAGQDADLLMPWTARSGAFMLVEGDKGGASKLTSATVTFDTPAALGNGWAHVVEGTSGTSTFTASFADGSASKTLTQGRTAYLACDGTAIRLAYFGESQKRWGARGAAAVFASHDIQTRRVRVARLSDTLAVCVYENTSNHPVVVALSVSGSTVTVGTPVVVEASSVGGNDMALCVLSSTSFALAYASVGLGTGRVVAGSVSGTTITMGAVVSFYGSGAPNFVDAVALSATKLAVFFFHASGYLFACTVDISGTTCSVNAAQTIYDANTIVYINVAMLSATKVVVLYNNGGGTGPVVQVVDISGSSFTPGTSRSFASANNQASQLVALTSTRVLLYRAWTSGGDLRTIDVSGTTMTMGPVLPVTNQPNGKSALARISDSQAALLADFGNAGYMSPYAVEVEDALPVIKAAGATLTSYVGGSPLADLCILNATQALVVYRDTANSNYGTARVLDLGTTV